MVSLALLIPLLSAQPTDLKPGVHQLFLDDVLVAKKTNVISRLHAPRKFAGNPVLMPTPGVESNALLYGSVLRDEKAGLFKMWYYTGRIGTKMPWCVAYAISKDGIHWKKPDLKVLPGLKKPANLVMTHPLTPNFGELFSVILDPRDPDPKRRYKMVYRYLTPLPAMKAIGTTTATSADGINWKPAGGVQVPKILDIGHFFFDKLTGKYAVYGRLYKGRRKVQLSLSDDFKSWTKPKLVADVDKRDPPGTHLYTMAVHNDGGQYVGLAQLYLRGTSHLLEFELAASRDGRNWTRVHQGKRFIACGGPGEWDRFNNSVSAGPVRVGDELWFYYSGRTFRHAGYGGKDRGTEEANSLRARVGGTAKGARKRKGLPTFAGMRSAIGLAKLRLDGYVSLGASFDGGSVTTVPVRARGSSLYVNAVSRYGEVVVEVLADGKPIATSMPVRGDGVRQKVRFPNGASKLLFSGKPVQLRFNLRNARLYSYWVK